MASTKQSARGPSSQRQLATSTAARIIDQSDASLLDLVDNLLNKGVVLTADVVLGVAGVDLVYLRLSALLCAADRVFSKAGGPLHGVRLRRQS